MSEVIYNQDTEARNQSVIDVIVEAINQVLQQKDQVVLAVPGGRSIAGLFKSFVQDNRIDWDKIQLFMIDERLVPLDHDDSNFRLVKEQLIDQISIPKENVHPFIFQADDSDFGIGDYQKELEKFGGRYDIIILGVGEDGHVAALFPHHRSIENTAPFFLTMEDSPKAPSQRMTASKKLLAQAEYGFILILGEGKKEAYQNFKNSELKIEDCPAKLINEIKKSYVITDLQ